MDRFAEYGLRGDQDELLRRAFRDAFQRAHGDGPDRRAGAKVLTLGRASTPSVTGPSGQ
jgi:hypothetical protein